MMKETALRLSYIGNHGSNLEQRWRWNDPESEYNYQAPHRAGRDLQRRSPSRESQLDQRLLQLPRAS